MSYGTVIAAAGMSTRMNDFKQLMKIGNMTFAERVVTNFRRAGVRDIVVVTGYRGEELEKSLKNFGLVFLKNEQYSDTGMFDSAKIGLSYLKSRCSHIFFCPVDVPFFTEETVRKEMSLSERADVIVPFCHERPGHPLLLSEKAVSYVLQYNGERGMRGAYETMRKERAGEVIRMEVDDDGAVMDADTKEDYQNLLDLHNARLTRPEIQIRLCKGKPFFGPETATLFRQIERLGNVREACEICSISYSKGWNMIRACEEELNCRIVERQAGGRDGGRSSLTKHGGKMLEMYEKFERELSEDAVVKFNEIFRHGDWLKESNKDGDTGGT